MSLNQTVLLVVQGRKLEAAGQYQQAANAYQQAVKLDRSYTPAYTQLARLLLELNQPADALRVTQSAPQTSETGTIELLCLQADSLTALEQHEASLEVLRRLESRLVGQGWFRWRLAKALDAVECYEQAIAHAEASREWGIDACEVGSFIARAMAKAGEYSRASALFEEQLGADPGNASLAYQYSQVLLALGNYSEALALFVRRWESDYFPLPPYLVDMPRATGEERDRRIWVFCEQGVGDQLLYAQALSTLVLRHEQVICQCDKRLIPLLSRMLPSSVSFVPEDAHESDIRARLQHCDTWVPAADVMLWHLSEGGVAPSPWIAACATRSAEFAESYRSAFPGKLRVGISWGSARAFVGKKKTVGLLKWKDILRCEHAQFFNLQYGETDTHTLRAEAEFGVRIFTDPAVDRMQDLDALAAQMCSMDLIITTSSVTAHLAGALGLPAFVLLPAGAGSIWYWGLEGESVPWYPSLRLFRAPEPNAWELPLARVEAALREHPGLRRA